ncbi:hypothetical protein ACJ5H2_18020 [Nocardioides sp. R1-1]|uniref:hypothetical protein n=1 Tax=Nocardioides sp. R1-1 TaxID=3383502 RepID=UPI0038D1E732
MRRLALMTAGVITLGGLSGLSSAGPASAAVRTVSYPLVVNVPDNGTTAATVNVTGLAGPITDVDVVLNGVTHGWPRDLDLSIQAPGSTKVVRLMSDVCGTNTSPLTGAVFTVDDEAAVAMPDSAACPAGSYRPTNNDAAETPPPGTTFADSLSAFDGSNANGTWTLHASDDLGGFVGQLTSGFALTITTDDAPGETTITQRPRSSTRSHRATVGFVADKGHVSFQCKVDRSAWKACSSPLKLKRLKPGKHKVRVRSVGLSGQVESTPAVVKWRVR